MFMVDIREQMMFNLEIESSWEMESPGRIDRMVSSCKNLMLIPVTTGWMSSVLMNVSNLGVDHEEQREDEDRVDTEEESLGERERGERVDQSSIDIEYYLQ